MRPPDDSDDDSNDGSNNSHSRQTTPLSSVVGRSPTPYQARKEQSRSHSNDGLSPLKIVIPPNETNQNIYNQTREEQNRVHLSSHTKYGLSPPNSTPSTASNSTESYDSSNCFGSEDLHILPTQAAAVPENSQARRPRGRRNKALDADIRLHTALKRKLKLSCDKHRRKKTTCDCHDFSKLEEGYLKSHPTEGRKHLRSHSHSSNSSLLPHLASKDPNPPEQPSEGAIVGINSGVQMNDYQLTDPAISPSAIPRNIASFVNPFDTASIYGHRHLVADSLRHPYHPGMKPVRSLRSPGTNDIGFHSEPLNPGNSERTVSFDDHEIWGDYNDLLGTKVPTGGEGEARIPSSTDKPKKYQRQQYDHRSDNVHADNDNGSTDFATLLANENQVDDDTLESSSCHLYPMATTTSAESSSVRDLTNNEPSTANPIEPKHTESQAPISRSSKTTIKTTLRLLDFLKSNYSNQCVELSSLITITGSAASAYATTCSEYLEKTWPSTGKVLLPTLQEAITKAHNQPGSNISVFHETSHGVTISLVILEDGTLEVQPEGPKSFVHDIMQQVAWISATFATSPLGYGNITYCRPVLESTHLPGSEYNVLIKPRFEKLPVGEKDWCWLSLFSNSVIAYGSTVPARSNEVGLEMSIELMAGIIGACHAVIYDGGVIIKGFSSMFVPVKKTHEGIQWHYVANSDPDDRLSYEDGVKQCPNRLFLPVLDMSTLKTVRCFIGWNGLVDIQLDQEGIDFGNIKFSDATEVKSLFRIQGGSVGFQQFGLAQLNVTFGKRDGKCHFQRNSRYRRIINAADTMSVALFDTGERRGYLLPASGVLLLILYHRMLLGLGGVPVTKVKLTPSKDFTETLMRNGKVNVSSQEDEPLLVEEIISEIWSIIELLQAERICSEKNKQLEIHTCWQDRLSGYEYMAVVKDLSPMPPKELEILKTSGGWPKLIPDINAVVLLASGFGDLIRPANEQETLCRQWRHMPRDKDYMAVPVERLMHLYSLAGSCQTKKQLTATGLQLHSRSTSLFEPCPNPNEKGCPCDRLSQISKNTSIGRVCAPELPKVNGAIIVGESGNAWKRLAKGHVAITPRIFSQPNMPFDSETLTNWTSDNSRSSELSEYSDFRDINSSCLTSTMGDNQESEDSPNNLGISDLDIDHSDDFEPFSPPPKKLCLPNKVGIRIVGDEK